MDLVLGIDLGTSYFKLGLFNRAGDLCGLGCVATPTKTANGSICEAPVNDFWSSLRSGLESALQQASARAEDIRAMGYSSQANSFLLLDEDNHPLTPLILWCDVRTATVDPAVRGIWEREDFMQVTGMGIAPSPEMAVEKVHWFRQHRPETWSRVRRVMMISDYLTFSLTARTEGDAGTACLLGICNPKKVDWWDEALRELDLPRAFLSRPLRPGTSAGATTNAAAELIGLPEGIRFVVGSLDHHMAAIGAGLGRTAHVSDSTGTVIACVCTTDEYDPKPNCCMGPGISRKYFQYGFDSNGASVLEWYQRTHAPKMSIPQLVDLAADIPPGSDGLIALPHANEHPDLEGFRNQSAQHTRAHYVRAVLESITASMSFLVDHLSPRARPERIVSTGGGARSDLWLQLKADMLGAEFVMTNCQEPACMGAAMTAAVAGGWFSDIARTGEAWAKSTRIFTPDALRRDQYAEWYADYRKYLSR